MIEDNLPSIQSEDVGDDAEALHSDWKTDAVLENERISTEGRS